MKTISKLSLALILAGSLGPASAQVTLTRVLEGDIAEDTGYFWGCAWGDYDQDGNVDLFVCTGVTSGSATNRLYHNNGNGTFTRITTGTPVNERADSGAAVWGDFDNDGDLDLFVSNFASPVRDFVYRNEGSGTFTKITQGAWVTDSGAGQGAAWGDYDNDGHLDLFVANIENQNDFLYHNNGDGTMTKITTGPVPNSGGESQGGAWADYDGDGDLDLFVANAVPPGRPLQNLFQFRNDGNGVFTRILTGTLATEGGNSGGISWGDYDNDGDLDLFVANGGFSDPPGESGFLYRNDGGSNNGLLVRLVGTVSNRSAIGAKVRVKATIQGKTFWQLREISGGSGFCSQNDLRVHFGLGNATNVEVVRIEWPSGIVQELRDVPAKQTLTVTEPARLQVTGPGEFRIQSWKGQSFEVQMSTNLEQWSPVTTVTNLTGTLDYTDAGAVPLTQRFYRVVSR